MECNYCRETVVNISVKMVQFLNFYNKLGVICPLSLWMFIETSVSKPFFVLWSPTAPLVRLRFHRHAFLLTYTQYNLTLSLTLLKWSLLKWFSFEVKNHQVAFSPINEVPGLVCVSQVLTVLWKLYEKDWIYL